MNAGLWIGITAWVAVVSYAAALKIKGRVAAAAVAVTSSAGIPLVLGILFASLFPWSPIGPEDLLERGFRALVGSGGAALPFTFLALAAGMALGFVAAYAVVRRRAC